MDAKSEDRWAARMPTPDGKGQPSDVRPAPPFYIESILELNKCETRSISTCTSCTTGSSSSVILSNSDLPPSQLSMSTTLQLQPPRAPCNSSSGTNPSALMSRLPAAPTTPLSYSPYPPLYHPYHWPSETSLLTAVSRRRKSRTVFTSVQQSALEERFAQKKYLSVPERYAFSRELCLTEQQVKTWFQNRRTKLKKETAADKL